MRKARREDFNVRGTILALEKGEEVFFPSVVKGTYIRNVCSSLKIDEDVVCKVNRIGESYKVTRLK